MLHSAEPMNSTVSGDYVAGPVYSISKWIWFAFLLRLVLMVFIHFTEVDKSMSLTKDAFLYDRVGTEMANYFSSNGQQPWPSRVEGYVDFCWEWFIGLTYYTFGHEPLLIKLVTVVTGALVPLLHYRMAKIVTNDSKISVTVLLVSAFFPTQVYYSALMVRDSISAFAVSLTLLGVVEFIRKATDTWPLKLIIGFVLILGLRSYLASLLAVIIPMSLLVTSFVSSGSRGRAMAGTLLIGITAVGSLILAPNLINELDTQYTDLEYVNKVRGKMNVGSGAMFSGDVSEVGNSLIDTATSFAVGLYFFFFSVNPAQLTSIRQIIALPEVAIVILGSFYAVKGGFVLWRERRDVILPVLIPTLIMTLGYSAATTNGGPLMRWRMQLLGVYLILGATGFVTSTRGQTTQYEPAYDEQGYLIG
ncbi:MAG: glycosyltransferase family 39 protein [Planctomycetota bacterium]